MSALTRLHTSLSHLAFWASLYVTGAVLCFSHIAGGPNELQGRHVLTLTYAFLTGAAVYLLDRIKARDAWLDPADQEAHPARFQFLEQHGAAVRVLSLAC